MADNITLNTNSTTGATLATDDIGGVHYQLIKLGYGALESFTIVTPTAGLPVSANNTAGAAVYVRPGTGAVFSMSVSNTPHVVVDSGAVTATISGTASVSITGTPNVSVANTPHVVVDSGAVTATVSGTAHVAIDSGTANVVVTNTAHVVVDSGAVTATVSGTASVTVTNTAHVVVDSGAVTATVSGTASVSVYGTPTVQGAVAHDGVAADNPLQIAGEARSSERAAVANADVARLVTDLYGRLIVLPFANPENLVDGFTATSVTTTTATNIIGAQGAGVKIYLTQLTVSNGDASTSTWVNILSGTTAKYTVFAINGGGATISFPTPLPMTANATCKVKCETAGATVRVSAAGYKGA